MFNDSRLLKQQWWWWGVHAQLGDWPSIVVASRQLLFERRIAKLITQIDFKTLSLRLTHDFKARPISKPFKINFLGISRFSHINDLSTSAKSIDCCRQFRTQTAINHRTTLFVSNSIPSRSNYSSRLNLAKLEKRFRLRQLKHSWFSSQSRVAVRRQQRKRKIN